MDPTISVYIGDNKIDLNFPSGFTLFGWTFHLYGTIIAVGFVLAVFYVLKRRKFFGIHDDSILDMLLFGVPLGIIGARAYYIAFSENSGTGDFAVDLLNALKIWNGGLAIYGGVIGAVIGVILFGVWMRHKSKKSGKAFKLLPYFDLTALGFMIGQAVGRWGNFTNRECYGSETNLPWRMGLMIGGVTRNYHPAFLYESLWNVLGFVALHFYSKRRKYDGEIFVLYLGWYGLGRAWIEGLRTDSLMIPGTPLRVSQLVALVCIFASIALMIYNRVIRNPDEDDLYANRLELAPEPPLTDDESEADAELERLLDEVKRDSERKS